MRKNFRKGLDKSSLQPSHQKNLVFATRSFLFINVMMSNLYIYITGKYMVNFYAVSYFMEVRVVIGKKYYITKGWIL
ncbi:hypothetical protein LIKHA_24 [Paenibacillus phage Likha]|uniref:Uncharacterized protein n=1 Tax=Paenibacillus phage Likha TaxID=2070193 RepID=A0A2I7SDG1_9CAUD|nr:hypothetical protein HWB48_gp24 [Paenibacillus phage Likha]AUS03923.1 hypothetical protein LIKHA_24 [Paenibacillus phage Likha]